MTLQLRTIDAAIHFGQVAGEYRRLRQAHPGAPALHIKRYIDADPPETFEQFGCKHEFNNPEEWERSYCLYCGLDGDS